jgi:hypothetical protein
VSARSPRSASLPRSRSRAGYALPRNRAPQGKCARARGHADAVYFNLLGLLDLVIVLGIGFLAGLGPYHPIDVTPSTEQLTLLPLALVPTVAVPVAMTLHIVSLTQLRHGRKPLQ